MPLFRRRRRSAAKAASLPRRPNAGLLRRERRALLAVREGRARDLGGLAVEMYRFGSWRSDLLEERCAELIGIDARIADIDALLGHGTLAQRCSNCGTPLREAVQRCPNCGAQVGHPRIEPPADTIVERPPRSR